MPSPKPILTSVASHRNRCTCRLSEMTLKAESKVYLPISRRNINASTAPYPQNSFAYQHRSYQRDPPKFGPSLSKPLTHHPSQSTTTSYPNSNPFKPPQTYLHHPSPQPLNTRLPNPRNHSYQRKEKKQTAIESGEVYSFVLSTRVSA